MSKRTIEKYFCDVCGKEADVKKVNYPVVFHTEQDEGMSVTPYISQENIDMCEECLAKAATFNGWGAQGGNHYKWRR